MPIYAYRCEACGHTKDVLQKISDSPLTGCPACGTSAFKKQVTAAGFQLKGSGWYVTDFRGGNQTHAKDDVPATSPSSESSKTESAQPAAAPAPPATTTPTPAPAPSGSPPASTK